MEGETNREMGMLEMWEVVSIMRTRTALVEAGIWRSGGGAMTSGLNELQDQNLKCRCGDPSYNLCSDYIVI